MSPLAYRFTSVSENTNLGSGTSGVTDHGNALAFTFEFLAIWCCASAFFTFISIRDTTGCKSVMHTLVFSIAAAMPIPSAPVPAPSSRIFTA